MAFETASAPNDPLYMPQLDKIGITTEATVDDPSPGDSSTSTSDGEKSTLIEEAPSSSCDGEGVEANLLDEVAVLCHCLPEDVEDVYACTPLQEGMMALTLRDSTAYTVEYEYQLPQDVELQQLRAAWEQAAQANPILRTRIVSTARHGCVQAVIRGNPVWMECSTEDEKDALGLMGNHLSWKAGQPLAYFTVFLARRVLKIVIHHSICDDWSMALLLREVEKAYRGETLAKRLFRPLVDYVQETRSQAEEFWKDKFRDAEKTPMSTYPPLPSVGYTPHPGHCRERSWDINPTLNGAFTVNTKMRLAWAILQSFYVDSTNVLFGAINVGRGVPVSGVEEISGPALTSVPVRAQLRMQDTVTEALTDMQQDWASGMPYEHVGLQNLLHLGPGPKAACGFQTLLAVEPRSGHQVPRLFARHRAIQRNYDLYGLILRCRPSDACMQVQAWFDPAAVEPRQIERILGQLAHIYDQIEQQAERTLADISPVSPEDHEELSRLNIPAVTTAPSSSCVHTLVEQRAQSQGDAQAIHSWDGDLSYRSLDSMASSLAAHLSVDLVRPGIFVPVFLPKSKWTPISMLAVMKAGGAFVLLDPSYPTSRLRQMCETVQAPVLITCNELMAKTTALGVATTVLVDEFDFETRRSVSQSQSNKPLPEVDPFSPLYATFTSGSTGAPKGVVVRHEGYVASALAHGVPYNFQPTARVLQFASPAFDSCIIEHLSPLIMGGCVCIPTQAECHGRLAEAVSQYRVNVACLTPSVARIMSPESVPTLHTLAFVGERVRRSDISRWAPQLQVRNAYGPAECSAVFSVQPHLLQEDSANIGFPTGGVGWVVDPSNHERLIPLGCTGELLIEGPIVGAGYIANPTQTARAFVDAPRWRKRFGPIQRAPLYKTGDLVQCIGDGSFRYIGRKDTQVKLHGQRLELGEIEHHVHQCFPEAKQVVVDMLRSDSGPSVEQNRPDAVLIGFVAGDSNTQQDSIFSAPTDEFRAACARAESHLSDILPAFMVPAVLLPISKVPLTPSGKLDRRCLREAASLLSWEQMQEYRTASTGSHAQQQPATATEERLRGIWAQVLNRPLHEIGVTDSFFRLGGDSISAMQAAAGCQAAGWAITVADIFRCPSVRKISQKIQEMGARSSFAADIQEDPTDAPFALSPVQLLFFEHVPDGHHHFTQQFLLRLTRPVPASKVRRAAESIVERHSMLRARFRRQDNGQWEQFITPDARQSVVFREHWVPSEDDGQSALKYILGESQGALNIEQGPLLVVDLIHEEESGRDLLGFIAHHLVVDLVSWRILLQDLEDILTSGRPTQTPSLSFQQWCRMQQDYALNGMDPQASLPRAMPSAPPLHYWGAGVNQNTWGQAIQETICLTPKTTQALLGPVNDAFNTDIVDILQASLLHSFTNTFSDRPCPTLFSEAHGREPWDPHINISRTVGWFTTIAPLVIDTRAGQDITEVLRRTKDGRRAIPGNGWPYFVTRYCHPDGKKHCPGHIPMEILFNYTGLFQQLERPAALLELATAPDHDLVPIPPDLPRFALIDVSATVLSGSLNVTFFYNSRMRHQDQLREWPRRFQQTLELIPQVLSQQQRLTVSDLPLLLLENDQQLQDLVQDACQKCGIDQSEIENIYPCAPIQLGMWLSQLKVADMYWSRIRWAVVPSGEPSRPVSTEQVRNAWQKVVNRHTILRTLFLNDVGGYEHPVQLVMKSFVPDVQIIPQDAAATDLLDARTSGYPQQPTKPAHKLLLQAHQDGRVSCLLTIHHTLMDGITSQIMLSDFRDAFNGVLDETPATPYSSYVAYLLNSRQSQSVAYWTEYLNGIHPCIFPPLANPGHTHRPQALSSADLNFGSTGTLLQFCRQRGITVSSVLRVAWGLVLRAYTGSDTVCFGYLTSGRDIPLHAASTIAGPLINLLICRLSLASDASVMGLLQDDQASLGHSIENQHWSMAEVLRSLGLSGQPLFNTAMSLQKPHSNPYSDSGSNATTLVPEGGHDSTEYAITVNVTIGEDTIHGNLTYWTQLLGDEQAELIADAFQQAVLQLVNAELESLNDFDILGEKGKCKLREWNHNIPEASETCIHSIILEKSAARPEATAISAWDGKLTYGELERIASSWAQKLLAEHGASPGAFVPICGGKSQWIVVAVLAILKAGSAFILLDPSHPAERLRDMVQQNFECPFILTTAEFEPLAVSICPKAIVIEHLSRTTNPDTPTDSDTNTVHLPASLPQSAAYAIFTSGTTGRPKASVIEHESFCSSAVAHSQALHIDEHSRVLQFASFAFDASIVEILTTLLAGGCVCVPSQDDKERRMTEAIQQLQVNWTLLTPSVARTLAPNRLPTLKTLVLGGEAMTDADVQRWLPHVELMNAYGPSECSVIATTQPSAEALLLQTANIGKGTGCNTWVADPRNANFPVPVGAPGELLLQGPIVGRGYVNRPEQQMASFLSCPSWIRHIAREAGAKRLYKTGDLVRYLPDGSLQYLGRKDRQVKLHGQRIELSEVEQHVLRSFPGDCHEVFATLVTLERTGSDYLVALVVQEGHDDAEPNSSFQTAVEETKRRLKAEVPAMLVPASILPLREVPRLVNGKVNRDLIRQQAAQALQLELEEGQEARKAWRPEDLTAEERVLQALWAEVLNRAMDKMGPGDNFFQLGGDSIAAMKLASAACSAGFDLTVPDIFMSPQLRDLAQIISTRSSQTEMDPVLSEEAPLSLIPSEHHSEAVEQAVLQCGIAESDIEDIMPCTALQSGLAVLTAERPAAYVAHHRLQLSEQVDLNKLKAAWEDIAINNPILRTRVIDTAGLGCLQVVVRNTGLSWTDADQEEEQISQGLPFGKPLVHFKVLHTSSDMPQRPELMLTMHHAVYDAWSLPLLLLRAQLAYHGDASETEAVPYQHFMQYALSQKDSALDYWQGQFTDMEIEPFPSLPSPSYRPRAIQVKRRSLQMGAFDYSVTRSTAIRLAWALVQAQYQGKQDIVFGTVSTGRTAPVKGIESMSGPTIATVPLRVVIDPAVSVVKALENLQQQITQMVPFEQVGLQTIAALGVNATRACSFQTLLNIEGRAEVERMVGKLDIMEPVDTTFADGAFNTYALHLTASLRAKSVSVEASFDDAVIPDWQMERMLDQFAFLLEQIDTRPHASLQEVMAVNLGDIQQLQAWNANIPPLMPATVVDVVDQHCTSQPFAPAVCAWDGNLNYQELDCWSSAIADVLESHGIGPETFVPIYLDRSRWVVVAALAVLKVGAAFVLLDTSYPFGRLRSICDEIRSPLIITSESRQQVARTLIDRVVIVGHKSAVEAAHPDRRRPSLPSDPHRALYAVFTSGSTGKPKGAIVENGAFVTMAVPYTRIMEIDTHSRVLHFASYAFDVSILEILGTLFAGACVCVLSESDRGEGLVDAVKTLQPSHTILTPSLLRAVTPGDLGPIRTVMLIGEPVRESDVVHWADHVRLLNTYGPAECTVVYTMQPSVRIPSRAANIGRPIAGAAWVADPGNPNRLVPIGAVGELLLQGPLVGRGYLNNPEQTDAAFISSPAWLTSVEPDDRQAQSKIYRTGDLVRYDGDGSLVFVGRRDYQVKLRGQRFELGEVENHVQRGFEGGLKDVVALIVKPVAEKQAPYLVVFVVPQDAERARQASPSSIPPLPVIEPPEFASKLYNAQRYLEDTLPSYMLPRAIIPLLQMPRTVGGKLDRRQLQEAASSAPRQCVEPFALKGPTKRTASTEAERTLQRIWARALGLPLGEIGVDDSFFRLGGDSISALQATTQARSVGIEHSVADLFHWRTIARVAQQFSPSPLEGIRRSDVENVLPCTPAQRGILLSQMRDHTSYAPHFIWKVEMDDTKSPTVNLDRLVTAWHQVVARHSALRTAFQHDLSNDGQFEQLILRQIRPRVNLIQNVPATDLDDGVIPTLLTRLSATVSQLDGETSPHQLTICTTDTWDAYIRLDISHVIIDAMSMAILESDLCRAYDASLSAGPQSRAYEDYVAFSQKQSSGPAYSYWQNYLEGIEPCRLPLETHQTDDQAADALSQLDVVLVNSGSEIDSYCRGTDWTASSLLYFAWALTLRAFTRSEDVCFGTLSSGRLVPVDGIDGAIGQFSNMSVCRVRMAQDLTLDEAALCLQEDFSNVLSYQAFPLIEIARAAGVPMEELTSTAINVQYEPSSSHAKKQSFSLIPVSGKDPISQDITVYVLLQRNGCIKVTMSYRPSHVSPAVATQVSEYFNLAVSSLLQGSAKYVQDLELLTPRDQDRLLCWNAPLPPPAETTVHELIQAQAREVPDHPAVVGSDGDFTYQELDQLGGWLASSLMARGLRRGQCVPLCFEKSRWVVVAILAVLKAGGTIVPLDPRQPLSRLRDICERVKPTLVLSSPDQASISSSLASDVLEVGDSTLALHRANIEPEAITARQTSGTPSQPVYILFTSGTTGTPKGVMISHSTYCYAAENHIRAFALDRTSRVLQVSSYSFDVSMMEILTTLIAGATVCTLTEDEKSHMLMTGACPFPVSHAYLTPSLASALDPEQAHDWIKTLVLQGEPMTASHITAWSDRCRLVNAYGPTECAVINTATLALTPEDDARCIGHGIGTHCWVVDSNDQNTVLPIGAIGELLLGGPSVGQGYLSEPEKTDEAFIKPPGWLRTLNFGGECHERLYKTGDLVRYDIETGNLLFEGRKDQQIKVHGQRVELAEVEHHTLRCFEGAKEVAVHQVLLPRPGPSSADAVSPVSALAPRLVACVAGDIHTSDCPMSLTADDPGNQSSGILLAPSAEFHCRAAAALKELRRLLPGYMVPDIIVPISHVPLSSSGKTDRSRLRQHLRAVPAASWPAYFSSQQTKRLVEGKAEKAFHEILSAVLDVRAETVGVDDSFYHLGGDSIDAVKIAAKARAAGFSISSHDILRHPTIREWASIANSSQKSSTPVAPRVYEPFSLVTDKEREHVLASYFESGGHPYTVDNVADIVPTVDFQSFYIENSSLVSMAEVFSAPLDMGRLYRACSKVMLHYSILRTIFVSTDDRMLQVILHRADPAFYFVECDDPQAYIAERSREKIAPTTKQGELLVSFTVVTSSTRPEWAFVVRLSHAQYDGTSLPFLWQAIAAAYEDGELHPTTQFREVVYNRLGDDHSMPLSFWEAHLQNAPKESADPLGVTSIPRGLGSKDDFTPLTVRREVDHHPRLPDITLATLVKASIAWVLSRHAAASLPDIVLGQVVHGRGSPVPGMETVFGPCINFLPIRISIDQNHTVSDLLRHVQAQQLATVPHDYVSLKHISSKCTSWPDDTRLGCIVHHQASQPSAVGSSGSVTISGVQSISSTSWANSTPMPGQVGIISIERVSSLDLYMTFPTEKIAGPVAEELADGIAHTIELFSKFADYPLAVLREGGVVFSQATDSTLRN